ncbi:MAG TPA: outer membrane beta-barrel protein [Cytophagaceae bacterium]|nr:outer membrane beta-barrel protein [Cytophagaceae bacterium]
MTLFGLEQRTSIINKEDNNHPKVIKNIPSYAPTYGITFSQNFSNRFGIDYGALVARQEEKYEMYTDPSYPKAKLNGARKVLYMQIPILLRADLLSKPKNVIFVAGGAQMDILLSEDGTIPTYHTHTIGVAGDTTYGYDYLEAAGAYKRFIFDLVGSMGWRKKIYKNFFLQLQLRANYSLSDVEDKSFSAFYAGYIYRNAYYIYSTKRLATHNLALGAGLGLCWKFR